MEDDLIVDDFFKPVRELAKEKGFFVSKTELTNAVNRLGESSDDGFPTSSTVIGRAVKTVAVIKP